MNLLAIDPGITGSKTGAPPACAYFSRNVLVAAKFEQRPNGAGIERVVVERPEYQGDRSEHARIQDLMALAWCGAGAAYYAAGHGGGVIIERTPTQWKGAEAKPVHHARLWVVLSPAEREVLGGVATYNAIEAAVDKGALSRWSISGADCYSRTFKTHNLLDAAALGCFELGRLLKAERVDRTIATPRRWK